VLGLEDYEEEAIKLVGTVSPVVAERSASTLPLDADSTSRNGGSSHLPRCRAFPDRRGEAKGSRSRRTVGSSEGTDTTGGRSEFVRGSSTGLGHHVYVPDRPVRPMDLSAVIEDVHGDPHRERGFYEYPELYEFFQSRLVDRDAQVGLLDRFVPPGASRVLEFGCGAGPLLVRIEDEYDEVLGVDSNEAMLELARRRVTTADVLEADFTEWSAAEEDRVFDVAALMGGLLHLRADRDLESFAENAYASLRPGGVFVTFFEPLSASVTNGSRDVRSVGSERYTVERHATSALTSGSGHYTTTYCFVITDEEEATEARMGTVFQGRLFTPERLRGAFSAAGFEGIEIVDGDGPAVLHARK
jgi:SAM-dependent methyltransferase